MSEKDIVVIKGSADGVRMIFDSDVAMNDVLLRLREKIKGAKGFFKGECNVYITGREFSNSDKIRVKSVMNTLFPEANILFAEIEQEPHEPRIHAQNHTQMGAVFMEYLMQTAEQSKGMLKSKQSFKPDKIDVKLYKCDLTEGDIIKTNGDVLVVGNVSKGASVETDGSVYIMGNLHGKVCCGNANNDECCIIALNFAPEEVSISGITKCFDEFAQENSAKIAYLIKNEINIKKIL